MISRASSEGLVLLKMLVETLHDPCDIECRSVSLGHYIEIGQQKGEWQPDVKNTLSSGARVCVSPLPPPIVH